MKLSKDTLDILKNFARINSQAILRPGNFQITIAETRNFLAVARIQETLPVGFSVNQLNNFLGVISLYDNEDVDFEFGEKDMVLTGRGGTSKITYRYTADKCILKQNIPPTEEEFNDSLGTFEEDVKFQLAFAELSFVTDTAKALKLPVFSVESEGGDIYFYNLDDNDDSTSTQRLGVGQGNGKIFRWTYPVKLLELFEDDYNVSINPKGTIRFQGINRGVTYFLAAKPEVE